MYWDWASRSAVPSVAAGQSASATVRWPARARRRTFPRAVPDGFPCEPACLSPPSTAAPTGPAVVSASANCCSDCSRRSAVSVNSRWTPDSRVSRSGHRSRNRGRANAQIRDQPDRAQGQHAVQQRRPHSSTEASGNRRHRQRAAGSSPSRCRRRARRTGVGAGSTRPARRPRTAPLRPSDAVRHRSAISPAAAKTVVKQCGRSRTLHANGTVRGA